MENPTNQAFKDYVLTIIEQQSLTLEGRIKIIMALRNLSQLQIAQKHNISPANLCQVIRGNRKTPKIRSILAQELGVSEDILFESKFKMLNF